MSAAASPPVALTIAGSDPSGGAGLQADLKTFAAFEVYGAAVATCLTAQNTTSVRRVHRLPPDFVVAQIDAVLDDLPVAAIKTGMLGDEATLRAVAARLERRGATPLVVDPVMVATSGDRLLATDALEALRTRLVPLADLVTPNLPEAAALAGRAAGSSGERREAARAIHALGARAVLIKGGHDEGPAIDLLFDGTSFVELRAERIAGGPTHGSGCTLSAAIAAGLARGDALASAIERAKRYVHEAIRRAPPLGHGARPLDHRVRARDVASS
jgi:hydroxymethylpyrimidine/phosphomethylpyrimidine kinase